MYFWFDKFKQGKYNLKDEPRSGRRSVLNNHQLVPFVVDNPNLTTREMESILVYDQDSKTSEIIGKNRMRTGKRNRHRRPDSPDPNPKSKRDDISINQLT
ncbi:hypothetical protein EVAR_96304_1 [Eumeta japonica]|uniref:Histone-lysine N-methyltransferase SETMAR n=1 Tax=Eumeta variegata TaxID=151549 RepID=A0A4C1VZ00_EUMVA|nr:hypothetical protein EVAR_96304_1 [Eumeta japonica]